MNEQNKKEETREKLHKWLFEETKVEVKKFNTMIFKWVLVFFIIMGVILGTAEALWQNTSLVMELGGLLFTTAGALTIALGAIPSTKTILDMACTYFDGNKYLAAEMLKSRKLAQWGIYLIVFGYLFFAAGLAIRVISKIS